MKDVPTLLIPGFACEPSVFGPLASLGDGLIMLDHDSRDDRIRRAVKHVQDDGIKRVITHSCGTMVGVETALRCPDDVEFYFYSPTAWFGHPMRLRVNTALAQWRYLKHWVWFFGLNERSFEVHDREIKSLYGLDPKTQRHHLRRDSGKIISAMVLDLLKLQHRNSRILLPQKKVLVMSDPGDPMVPDAKHFAKMIGDRPYIRLHGLGHCPFLKAGFMPHFERYFGSKLAVP